MHDDRASHTAAKIARQMLFLEQHPTVGPLLPDGVGAASKAVMEGCGLLKPWHLRAYRSRWFAAMVRASDRFYPGYMLHMVLRKRVFDDEARTAITSGTQQVLVVGAGFDTLCVRLAAEHPDVVFVEVDHPATHAAKLEGVRAAGLERDNLHLVAADLSREPLAEVLEALPVWHTSAQSFVVAEGLLMYLTPEAVRGFFEAVARSVGPASLVAFTYVLTDARGRIGGELGWTLRTSLAAIGEGLRWGPRLGELAGLLEQCGLSLCPPIDFDARYVRPAGLGTAPARGERFAMARRPREL